MNAEEQRLADISAALDMQLLNIVRDGLPLLTSAGKAVLDAAGEPVMVPPSASYLSVARGRLKDLDIDKVVVPGDDADMLGRELHDDPKILKMPEITEEPDAATKRMA